MDQGDEGQQRLSCCVLHGHAPPLASLRPAVLLLQLVSSRLLLALQCLTFSWCDSASVWTSRLLSLPNKNHPFYDKQ